MPLDPHCAAVLEHLSAADSPPLAETPLADARAAIRGFTALMGPPEAGVTTRAYTVTGPAEPAGPAGPGGPVPVVVYRPDRRGALPVLVYLHGGGWVLGDTALVDPVCRALANRAGCLVVSPDYRLAPEHPYPVAAEECFAVIGWVARQAATIGADATRIAVGGDSAGANLAAAVALMSRDRGGPPLALQLLVCPALDHSPGYPSYSENGEGYVLTSASMRWFWQQYLGDTAGCPAAYAAPMLAADLSGVAPAVIYTAEFDILRDEGEAYGDRLRAAGVPVEIRRYDGLTHGFFWMAGVVPAARDSLTDAGNALHRAFQPVDAAASGPSR